LLNHLIRQLIISRKILNVRRNIRSHSIYSDHCRLRPTTATASSSSHLSSASPTNHRHCIFIVSDQPPLLHLHHLMYLHRLWPTTATASSSSPANHRTTSSSSPANHSHCIFIVSGQPPSLHLYHLRLELPNSIIFYYDYGFI